MAKSKRKQKSSNAKNDVRENTTKENTMSDNSTNEMTSASKTARSTEPGMEGVITGQVEVPILPITVISALITVILITIVYLLK